MMRRKAMREKTIYFMSLMITSILVLVGCGDRNDTQEKLPVMVLGTEVTKSTSDNKATQESIEEADRAETSLCSYKRTEYCNGTYKKFKLRYKCCMRKA